MSGLTRSVNGKVVPISPQEEAQIRTEWEANAPNPVNIRKEAKLSFITNKRNQTLKELTAVWDGDVWDANEETSNRIASALTMIREASAVGIPTPTSISWRTYDNKDRDLTIAELIQMGASVFLAQQMVWAKQATLKNYINNTTTVEEIDSVDWV